MIKVSVIRCPDYDQGRVFDSVKRAVDLIGGISRFVRPGQSVLIKPNMLGAHPPQAGITTHPSVLKAVIGLVKAAGGKPSVGDSPGFDDQVKAFDVCGYKNICAEAGAEYADFSIAESISNPNGKRFKHYTLARAALNAEVIINVAKFKTHHLTGITGAVKNLFGYIPGLLKSEYHMKIPRAYDFSLMLLDIVQLVKPSLSIMDAVIAMEGAGGPVGGKLKNLELIAASSNAMALDQAVCQTLGIDASDVLTVKAAIDNNLAPESIELIGDRYHTPGFENIRVIDHNSFPGPVAIRRLLSNILIEKPALNRPKCIHCKVCFKVCKSNAITFPDDLPVFNYDKCIRCFCCAEMCPRHTIDIKRSPLGRVIMNALKSLVGLRSKFKQS